MARIRTSPAGDLSGAGAVEVVPGRSKDAADMAALFLECFPDSVRTMFGERPPRPRAMTDFFAFVLAREPGAVYVARRRAGEPATEVPAAGAFMPSMFPRAGTGGLIGYVIAPRDMPRLWLIAALTGAWVPWVLRFIGGHYGLGPDVIPRVLRQKLAFAATFGSSYRCRAQILSLAVAPGHRGHGLASALISRGLDYLRSVGARRVKLEVLRDNHPALNLYRREGFRPVGEMPDGYRRWIVMVKDLSTAPLTV